MSTDLQNEIYAKVIEERTRQDEKFGANRNLHPLLWIPILTEEVGEVAKAVNESVWDDKVWDSYYEELIQVAAVCFAMLENFNNHDMPVLRVWR